MRKGTTQYSNNLEEIKVIDGQLSSGVFGVVSLIVNNRLFIANIGTCHAFLCHYDKKTNDIKVSVLETEHSLNNYDEMQRLKNLYANLEYVNNNSDKNCCIKHTRCLGNFKIKMYYHEHPQFR